VGIWSCGRCGHEFTGGAYIPSTKLGEIAERASRAGVASSLLAELKAEKARAFEKEAKAKAPVKRRRKRAEVKKLAEEPKEEKKPSEDKSAQPA
jgi:hypothetical protein